MVSEASMNLVPTVSDNASGIEVSSPTAGYELVGGILLTLVRDCTDGADFLADGHSDSDYISDLKRRVDLLLECQSLYQISELRGKRVGFTQTDLDYLSSPLLDALFNESEPTLRSTSETKDSLLHSTTLLYPPGTDGLQEALIKAAGSAAGFATVRMLVERGADVNADLGVFNTGEESQCFGDLNRTLGMVRAACCPAPLAAACQANLLDTVLYLLHHGANAAPHSTRRCHMAVSQLLHRYDHCYRIIQYPLVLAAVLNHHEVVQAMLEVAARDIDEALRVATWFGHVESTLLLLRHPLANINVLDDKHFAHLIRYKHLAVMRVLEDFFPERAWYAMNVDACPLTAAVQSGSCAMVEYCLKRGCNAGMADSVAFETACGMCIADTNEQLKIIDLLVRHGAVLDDLAALRAAVNARVLPVIDLLFRRGAPLTDFLFTEACRCSTVGVVSVLCEYLTAQQVENGLLARGLIAASCARLDVVHLLLEVGADPTYHGCEVLVELAGSSCSVCPFVLAKLLQFGLKLDDVPLSTYHQALSSALSTGNDYLVMALLSSKHVPSWHIAEKAVMTSNHEALDSWWSVASIFMITMSSFCAWQSSIAVYVACVCSCGTVRMLQLRWVPTVCRIL